MELMGRDEDKDSFPASLVFNDKNNSVEALKTPRSVIIKQIFCIRCGAVTGRETH
jgi:hypothetical protein